MISISYIYIALIFIIIWVVYRVLSLKKSDEKNTIREIVINIFFLYFLVLISLTICKSSRLDIEFGSILYINYIPFVETINMFRDANMGVGNALYNVIGNILLFMPLGFFIPLLFHKKNKLGLIALYGAVASLMIEIIQAFTAMNLCDIDDIIFNTLGAILGCITFNILYKVLKKTKIGELIRKVSSSFNANLLVLAAKPIGIMVLLVSILSFTVVYNTTMSGDLSDDELAKSVFQYSVDSDFEVVTNIGDYKLFLKDEGNYLDLRYIKSVLNNRWYNAMDTIGQTDNTSVDYSVGTLHDGELTTVVVFGKNKSASKIKIEFNGKEYTEEIKENEYFVVPFPTFETLDDQSDVFNFFDGEVCKDLRVTLYDSNGNEYYDMN